MGIFIDLIDPNTYKPPPTIKALPTEDFEIVHPSSENGVDKPTKSRIAAVRPTVPWLKKTQYISGFSAEEFLSKKQDDKKKENESSHPEEMARADQIKVIEDTFESIRQAPRHPTKPNLEAVSTFDIFPNFDVWPNQYNQVQFDGDPVPADIQDFPKEDAILKGFVLEKDKVKVNVLGYLVPKKT